MAITIKLRHDTAANWTTADPVLAAGECGVETDTRKCKYGDGATAWTALLYAKAEADVPDASNTVEGIIRIATDAEIATGTDETLAVNPKQLADAIEDAALTEIDGGGA